MDPESELREVFKAFDANHDGFIVAEELFNVLMQLGEKITLVKSSSEIIKFHILKADQTLVHGKYCPDYRLVRHVSNISWPLSICVSSKKKGCVFPSGRRN